MKLLPALCTLAACSALAGHSLADEFWRQSPINTFGGPSSQDARNLNGLGWFSEVADNFQAGSDWIISDIEFWGGYAATTPGNTHGFSIRFYSDNNGTIGSLLSSQDVFTFTETSFYVASGGQVGYHNTLSLATPFSPPAPGMYWMSVVAILDRGNGSPEPQWGWVPSGAGTGPSAQQWFFAPGQFAPLNEEMSFVLSGTTGSGSGICCRGATCNATVPAASCSGPNQSFVPAASACNTGGSHSVPCCYADYNKAGGVSVQDIFDFLSDWFAGSPFASYGGDGATGTVTVQNIFDFLSAWFAGC